MTDDVQTRELFRFEKAASIDPWTSNHDRVMGGVSTGKASWTDEHARFAGELSLENNGGFASFRVQPTEPLALSDFDGLRLRVRGDGRNWSVSLRTGQDLRTGKGRSDHNWQAPFQTRRPSEGGPEWQEVTIPFDAFVPVFHGRYAPTAEPMDRANIANVGLQVSDGQEGDYTLDVLSIDAWAASAADGVADGAAGTIGASERRTEALGKALDEAPSADRLLSALRWSERVLVIGEPLKGDDYGKDASIQRGRLIASLDGLVARDLRVVHLLGERAAIVAGRQLDSTAAKELREHWGLAAGEWSCALVGKDGEVKKRWAKPFEPVEAFETIDAMPMRRSEMEDRPDR
ncbi:CIA30 family protein [Saltatorellus ferox]